MNYPRRVPQCNRKLCCLLLVPLALLVPLFALQWYADHPPLSQMDREFQRCLGAVSEVHIKGYGPIWKQLTGLNDARCIRIADRRALQALGQALRCTDDREVGRLGATVSFIEMEVPLTDPRTHLPAPTEFFYNRCEGGSYVQVGGGMKGKWSVMQSRFVPRFEDLIAGLATHAREQGEHPAIIVEPLPTIPPGVIQFAQ